MVAEEDCYAALCLFPGGVEGIDRPMMLMKYDTKTSRTSDEHVLMPVQDQWMCGMALSTVAAKPE